MEHLLQLLVQLKLGISEAEFQSLFLWNIYFNTSSAFIFINSNLVSILIFMEHLLQQMQRTVGRTGIAWVSILIFMEHLLQPDKGGEISMGTAICFNPYFYGTSTSTSNQSCIAKYFACSFQSLFLWNIYFNLDTL